MPAEPLQAGPTEAPVQAVTCTAKLGLAACSLIVPVSQVAAEVFAGSVPGLTVWAGPAEPIVVQLPLAGTGLLRPPLQVVSIAKSNWLGQETPLMSPHVQSQSCVPG